MSLFNIFRNKCEHDYIYYNRETISLGLMWSQFEYRIVCNKCGKKRKIQFDKMDSIIKECEEKYKIDIALGKINDDDFENASFTIKPRIGLPRLFEGKHLNLFFDYYKKRGIDIRIIQD